MSEILTPDREANLHCRIADLEKQLKDLREAVLSNTEILYKSLNGKDPVGCDLPFRVEFQIDTLLWYAGYGGLDDAKARYWTKEP